MTLTTGLAPRESAAFITASTTDMSDAVSAVINTASLAFTAQ